VCRLSFPFIDVIDMRRVTLVTAALVLVAIALPSDAQPRAIDPKRSTVTVHVFKSGLFRAFADDHVIEAPLAEGSLDDSATPSVRVAIDVRDMRVLDPGLSSKDRREVQTRMLGPEVLDAARFTDIRFFSVAIQKGDADRWSIRGELEVHGQIRQVTVNVARDQGHYKGSTSLKQSDCGITPISIVGGTVKVKDVSPLSCTNNPAAQSLFSTPTLPADHRPSGAEGPSFSAAARDVDRWCQRPGHGPLHGRREGEG
jgi:YceI-like protein